MRYGRYVANQVPLESNDDFKKGLIRSFSDDEGSVNSNSHTVRLHQDNKELLEGIKEDGRKRALFILLNFFGKVGYNQEAIEEKIKEWNSKNAQPLKEGYVRSQLSWYKRNKSLLPPNCDNQAYYRSLLVCKPDNFCSKIKNPAHYAVKRQRLANINKKKPRKRRSKSL